MHARRPPEEKLDIARQTVRELREYLEYIRDYRNGADLVSFEDLAALYRAELQILEAQNTEYDP